MHATTWYFVCGIATATVLDKIRPPESWIEVCVTIAILVVVMLGIDLAKAMWKRRKGRKQKANNSD